MFSSTFRRTFKVLVLTYLLAASSFSPFIVTATTRHAKPIRSTQVPATATHRAGELLVRFRAGVSERDKELVLVGQEAAKTWQR